MQWLNRLIILYIASFILSWWNLSKLPDAEILNPSLLHDPIQTDTSREPFTLTYGGKTLDIKPLANYELWALVSSLSDVSFILQDHEPSDINVRDVCAIWGADLNPQILRHISTYNGQWTCYTHISAPEKYAQYFHVEGMDNLHLLTHHDEFRKRINHMHIGDQIYIRGLLVSYHQSDWGDTWRKSSLVNNAVGNGACKVIFVEDVKILAAGNPRWHSLYFWSKWICVLSLVIRFLHYIFVELQDNTI